MQSLSLCGLVLGLLLLCCDGVLLASEADELREKAKAMRKEASALAERGNMKEAAQLKNEAAKLLEAAEGLGLTGKVAAKSKTEMRARHPKERLQDLLAQARKLKETNASEKELAEVREQIAGVEKELASLRVRRGGKAELPPEFRPQIEKLEAATRRIHHFRVAAENLQAAEAHDLARELMERAEAMERDVREAKTQLAAEMHKRDGEEPGEDVVRGLHAEIERLRAEVKELRQQLDKR